jgi:TetR/AcrR family transcriptional regulator
MAGRGFNRRQQILQALAQMLEDAPGERVTTAGIARQVGLSEAALYRHFSGKAEMFEALIAFSEESIFGLINRVMSEERACDQRLEKILLIPLLFAERNPGIARLLIGDLLTGEVAHLRGRISQLYDRIETQLKQVLREGHLVAAIDPDLNIPSAANLLLAAAVGQIHLFVRSSFQRLPSQHWSAQWPLLVAAILTPPPSSPTGAVGI